MEEVSYVGLVTDGGAVWGIVLAAGSGRRFGGRKQFARVAGERLVDLAIEGCRSTCDRTMVVLPAGSSWDGPAVSAVVTGGETRGASVRAALDDLPQDAEVVVIHGPSHPLASEQLFRAVISTVRAGAAAAVPGLRPSDVVGRVGEGHLVETMGRDDLVLVQTPGAFRPSVLRTAHDRGTEAAEDSELVRRLGETVAVVPGEPWNLHVVTPGDLELARCVQAMRARDARG